MATLTLDSTSRPSSGIMSPRLVRSRAQSISSDRPSTIGFGLVLPPMAVTPAAAFIAHSAASQIITNDHDSHADAWYDQNCIEPATETAIVSGPALQLVNGFLDQLLFNFLQLSKSTSLTTLRLAVIEILKPKLAKDAITNADEELREYLGGASEDDYTQPQGSHPARDWDLELVWKRIRLRCMVYSSLGDMEEEDEDLYMEEEYLEICATEDMTEVISPAVAIFLTSVIEYMGELTLTVAGQAAYQRVRSKIEKELREGSRDASDPAERIVVSEHDVERVALDRTLGRLWRGWKKRMRGPTLDFVGRPLSKGSSSSIYKQDAASPVHEAQGSPKLAAVENNGNDETSQEHEEETTVADVQPADVPLPLGANDVEEIEVPGLVHYSDEEEDSETEDEPDHYARRPKSLCLDGSVIANGLPTPSKSESNTPVTSTRKRSVSLPALGVSQFYQTLRQQLPEPITQSDAALEVESDLIESPDSDETIVEPVNASRPATASGSRIHSDESDYEEAALEKAEIITSSRVSMSGSVHTVESGSPKIGSHKRSSSVHSARIVDVIATRSSSRRDSSQSRPTSIDSTERVRPICLSGVAHDIARAAQMDERSAVHSNNPGQSGTAAAAVAPPERKRSLMRNATTISELEEEMTQKQHQQALDRPERPAGVDGVLATDSPDSPSPRSRRGPPVSLNTSKLPAYTHEASPLSAPVASLPAFPLSPASSAESVPDLPRKTPSQLASGSPRADAKGHLLTERTKTRESDELSLPLQSNAGPRQIHTAASSISSGASRLRPVRTSEDNSSRTESVARNFEELIQSNQTITYTLTPENMRDIDSLSLKPSFDSPVVTKFARRWSEDARAHYTQKSPAPITPRPPPSPASPKVSGNNAGNKSPGHIPWTPNGISMSSPRSSVGVAREARVPLDSTSDFAEFIKSTGPAGSSNVHAASNVSNPASPVSPVSPVSPTRTTTLDAGHRLSATNSVKRLRYQPREAVVGSRADHSDLIDFIRQGPPIAASNHRIPRHVAPFRTTMDSDQMSGAIGGKAVDAHLPDLRNSRASTNATESSMPSMQSSINSRSALLNKKASMVSDDTFDDDHMMPKRKTRRVRDPYAIDLSDEEDEAHDHIVTTPQQPVKKEESLAEFLKNYDPPPEPASTPRFPKKKASAPSLIGRFTRGTKDKDKEPSATDGAPGPQSPKGRVNAGRGYIPIQVTMPPGYDKYGPIDSNSNGRQRGVSTVSSGVGRVPMKKFEPREAVSNRSATADLAAFLRDSAPPMDHSAMSIDRTQSRQEEGNGGISKMFGRRKKSLAV